MSAKCAQPAHAHKRERESERHVHANTHTVNQDGTQWACRYLWPFGRLYIYLYAVNNYVTPSAHVCLCVCGTSHASCYGNTPIICSGASNNAPVAVISGLGAIDKSNDNFQFPTPNASKDSQTKAQRHTRPVSLSLPLPSTLSHSLLLSPSLSSVPSLLLSLRACVSVCDSCCSVVWQADVRALCWHIRLHYETNTHTLACTHNTHTLAHTNLHTDYAVNLNGASFFPAPQLYFQMALPLCALH